MPWLSRSDYQALLKRNDDRDFAAALRTSEKVLSELRALRTYCQRQFKLMEGLDDDDGSTDDDGPTAVVPAIPGGWSR